LLGFDIQAPSSLEAPEFTFILTEIRTRYFRNARRVTGTVSLRR